MDGGNGNLRMFEKFQKPNDADTDNLAAIFPHLGHVEANVTALLSLSRKFVRQ